MANKIKQHCHEGLIWAVVFLSVAVVLLYVTCFAFRGELDELREDINIMNADGKVFNFNVECEGNDILASANHSTDSYELYKKMIKIYDTENCEIYDVEVSGGDE